MPAENPPPPVIKHEPSQVHDPLLRASDPTLTEDLALTLLKSPDLPAQALEHLAKNGNLLKLRKVRLALVSHPHTPRHLSVPLARQLYTFDLVKVALSPAVPADMKVAADEILAMRLKTITVGERLTLARRASGRVAARLLLDSETRVMQSALQNPRLNETLVIQALLRPQAGPLFIQAVAKHPKWSYRREVRIALLHTEYLSLARALEFSQGMPPEIGRAWGRERV